MKNKVFYGEYSLKHWINLLLTGNIILPKYQRSFVWEKQNVIKLIESIADEHFIPSVTIGSYENRNLIIDGQQRLTSILLAYLGIYPNKESFRLESYDTLANQNDDIQEDDADFIIGWTFRDIVKLGNSKQKIKESNSLSSQYDDLSKIDGFKDLNLDDAFFENHYLGFSYLIPQDNQQKYFSSVFRNINENGKKLSALETRKSLYFLKDGMDDFFDPNCIKDIFIERDKKKERIDFVRYLSFGSSYQKNKFSTNSILKKYGKNEEAYYSLFIDDYINENNNSKIFEFSKDWKDRINKLEEELKKFDIKNKNFISIIDCDIYMFGLVYYVIFENKSIQNTLELKKELDSCIESIKNDSVDGEYHKKSPATLKFLRPRLNQSLEIFKRYVK